MSINKVLIVALFILAYAKITVADAVVLDASVTDASEINLAVQGSNAAVSFSCGSGNVYPIWLRVAHSENDGSSFTVSDPYPAYTPSTWYREVNANMRYDSGGGLNYVWTQWSDASAPQYMKSTNNGSSFGTAVSIQGYNLPRSSGIGYAINGNTQIALYFENANGLVGFSKSTDGGANWSYNQRTLYWPGSVVGGAIFASSGNFFALGDIVPRTGTDSGLNIMKVDASDNYSAVQISDDSYSYSLANDHNVVESDGTLYVAFTREGVVMISSSDDDGATWSTPLAIDAAVSDANPVIGAMSSGELYLAWEDDVSGTDQIVYATSDDGGLNWSASSVLNASANAQADVDMVIIDDVAHLAWTDNGTPMYMQIPEPATVGLLGSGSVLLICMKRRRK